MNHLQEAYWKGEMTPFLVDLAEIKAESIDLSRRLRDLDVEHKAIHAAMVERQRQLAQLFWELEKIQEEES